jgi:hypothetical protein
LEAKIMSIIRFDCPNDKWTDIVDKQLLIYTYHKINNPNGLKYPNFISARIQIQGYSDMFTADGLIIFMDELLDEVYLSGLFPPEVSKYLKSLDMVVDDPESYINGFEGWCYCDRVRLLAIDLDSIAITTIAELQDLAIL